MVQGNPVGIFSPRNRRFHLHSSHSGTPSALNMAFSDETKDRVNAAIGIAKVRTSEYERERRAGGWDL